MDRTDFEAIRDIAGKIIEVDIVLAQRAQNRPAWVAENIPIFNDAGRKLFLNVSYNPESGSKVFNVRVEDVGPICRLCVDGTVHGDAGRSHKHSLQEARCPDRNLPDGVIPRKDLAGRSLLECFAAFCEMAQIDHRGKFEAP